MMKISRAILLFFIGIMIFFVGLILPGQFVIFKNLLFVITVFIAGYHVIGEGFGDTIKMSQSQHKFVPNIHILMCLAGVGAIIIGSFEEAALLILIFAGAHFLEEYAENKSRQEITSLLKMAPAEAHQLQEDGSWKIVAVTQLKVGDTLKVLNGSQVPTDGTITKGSASINEAAINGESIPREKQVGDEVFGGTINGNSTFEMVVTKDSQETVFAQIIEMVQTAQDSPGRTATTIQKLEPLYVKTILFLLPLVLLAGPFLLNWSWSESFYRMIGFLVAASPCALAASAVPATLSGISNLAHNGVLFKGGSYLANLSQLRTIAFDKTGTLTQGVPLVTDQYFNPQIAKDELLDIIVTMEKQSNHPLASAIVHQFPQAKELSDLSCQNKIGSGLEADYRGHHYVIGKLAPSISITPEDQQRQQKWSNAGKTVVYIVKDQQVVGLLALMDLPKTSAQKAIKFFNRHHIKTVMLTGDSTATGEAVAEQLQVQQTVANILPEKKVEIIKSLQQKTPTVAMVGDGVNDAPALANANIGIAMGSGTDVAIDVADVVLVKNDLSRLTFAYSLSGKMNKIILENIIFSLAVVVLLTILNLLQMTNIAWGVFLHEGSTLLVIVNGLRLLLFRK